ncbi:MAG: ThiF family adenylyltransferase, partial [Methylococcaceae bacterium]
SLQTKRIAIAGMGGVGGSHLLTLARLGIGAFNIADFDVFELANFNRQAGANLDTVGKPKAQTLAEQAKKINPELDIKIFSKGVSETNLAEFLTNVDLYIDGLDFFVLDVRRNVFDYCTENGIPAITAAPLGMGTAVLNFLPGKMTFEGYFKLEGHSKEQQQIRFLLGLSPAMLQRNYLVDPSSVDFNNKKGPSTPMACEICAGVAATQALKILLNRGKVLSAPWGLHFDPFRNKMAKTWRPFGNDNLIQKIAIKIATWQLGKMNK